jgi:hypothetical protein
MVSIGQIAPKLQRLLLMLSSDQPGEVVAAAAAIKRTLRSKGCDFHDLAAGLTASPSVVPNSENEDWRAMRDECLKCRGHLRGRELDFLTSLKTWRGRLTLKQQLWLSAIYERLQRAA